MIDRLSGWLSELPGLAALVGVLGIAGVIDPVWLLIQSQAPNLFAAAGALLAIAPHVELIDQDIAVSLLVGAGVLYLFVKGQQIATGLRNFVGRIRS